MSRVTFESLLEAGAHFGHLKRKWNPAMAPYIFMERNGIHIIDLHKTAAMTETAAEALKQIAKSGKKILFVSTKKQLKEIVAEKYDIKVNLDGGGYTGQSQALRLAIARALVKINPEDKKALRAEGFMTRDAREVERKKPGQPKARRRFQFSKR